MVPPSLAWPQKRCSRLARRRRSARGAMLPERVPGDERAAPGENRKHRGGTTAVAGVGTIRAVVSARLAPRGVSSMVEQWTFNPLVQGSSPWRPTEGPQPHRRSTSPPHRTEGPPHRTDPSLIRSVVPIYPAPTGKFLTTLRNPPSGHLLAWPLKQRLLRQPGRDAGSASSRDGAVAAHPDGAQHRWRAKKPGQAKRKAAAMENSLRSLRPAH
jgi:hypothetical protein